MPKNPELGRHFRKGESYGFARRPDRNRNIMIIVAVVVIAAVIILLYTTGRLPGI
jgi:hypothetical protein